MSASLELNLLFTSVYVLLCWALYVPLRTGQLYNGPIFCMAIGGYAAAYSIKTLHVPVLAAVLLAVFIGTLVGLLPALAFSRTSGIGTAMGSIALIYIVQAVFRNVQALGGGGGIYGIPIVDHLLPAAGVAVAVVGIGIYRLERSQTGRVMEAALTDPDLASSVGASLRNIYVLSMTISGGVGALAGVVYALAIRSIQPETFGFALLMSVWSMVFLGGRYTMWGPLLAAPILWGFPQWVPGDIARYSNILYGAALVVVILLRPQGLVSRGLVRRLVGLAKGRVSAGSATGT